MIQNVAQFKVQGPIPTLWDYDGADDAYRVGAGLLKRMRPPMVKVHAWPSRKTIETCAAIRRDIPGTRVMIAVGVDGVAKRVAQKTQSVSSAVDELVGLADKAVRDCGAEAFEYNAEAAWKRPPNSEEYMRLQLLISTTLQRTAALHPNLPLGHTAYDHPTYHSTYPWKLWIGEDSPIGYSAPQVYAAPGGDVRAKTGDALDHRETRALESWSTAIRKGWIREDAPDGSAADMRDIDWIPYYQAHHVQAGDTISSALLHDRAFFWAVPTRMDANGEKALLALSILWRDGYWSPNGVERFQREHGLKADNVPGNLTIPAILATE